MDLKSRSRIYAEIKVANRILVGKSTSFDSNDIERAHYEGGMFVLQQLEPVLVYSGNENDVIMRQIKEVIKSLMQNPFKL